MGELQVKDQRDMFQGMGLREIRGMPMSAEATGLQIAFAICHDEERKKVFSGFYEVALKQERYVRDVFARCKWWRPRKRLALRFALDQATRVANAIHDKVVRDTAVEVNQGAEAA